MACIELDFPTLVCLCARWAYALFTRSRSFCVRSGGRDACDFIRFVLWVGLTSAAHCPHALGYFRIEVARAALAMAENMGFGFVGGHSLGSLGAASGQFLVELCRGGCIDAV
jgi:hypothetical protein